MGLMRYRVDSARLYATLTIWKRLNGVLNRLCGTMVASPLSPALLGVKRSGQHRGRKRRNAAKPPNPGRCCGAASALRETARPCNALAVSLEHKRARFSQTWRLAASSAPRSLCDLHYSEVSNPLPTGAGDKKKQRIPTLKNQKKPK